MAGALASPIMPLPAATMTFSALGARSMQGKPSKVIGRQPAHSAASSPRGASTRCCSADFLNRAMRAGRMLRS